MSKIGVIDLESNGLLDSATVIWCATVKELGGSTVVFMPHKIKDLPKYLDGFDVLVGHNLLGFDLPLLKKLLNYEFKGEIRDTLLYSRILFPDMDYESYIDEEGKNKKAKSRHGLENWGLKLGIAKPQYDKWDEFTEEMLYRNMEDVKITEALYNHIQNHIKKLQMSDKRLQNWDKIFRMETKFWQIAEKQASTGWLFDINLAFDLEKELDEKVKSIDKKLEEILPLNVVKPYRDQVCKGLKKDGSVTTHALNWVGIENEDKVAGDFSRVKYEKTNLDSPEQLKEWLYSYGWVAKEWNFKRDKHNKPVRDEKGKVILTSPKTPKIAEDWQEIEDELKIPQISLLSERQKASHRLSSLRGWIEKLRPDQRLEAQMNTCGTNTARCQHRIIVNVPKASDKVYYGKQFRSLFICPPNKLLVGVDASALEGRCEAHYLYPFDKGVSYELIHGDIHLRNAEVFGVTRDEAKGGKYALLYGCSAPKLAVVLNKSVDEARYLYDKYWEANPGLKHLVQALERQWDKHGYLVAIDGRPLTVRYKHALLNTLLQSCGSIIIKTATCILDLKIKKEQLDANFLGHFHDEYDLEVAQDIADYIGKIGVEAMNRAGEYYKLNAPIDGEYKIGKSWAEIH